MMLRPLAIIGLALATLALTTLALASPAHAERIVASVSNHRVQVSSSFTGEELVLFGTIERAPNDPQRRGGYDVIATVSGPRQNLVTFRRDRVVGIWVNVDSRVFDTVPAYLAVLANLDGDELRLHALGCGTGFVQLGFLDRVAEHQPVGLLAS